MRTCLGSCLLLGLAHLAFAGDRAVVERTPGLVAFWTFGEEAGQARVSSGTRDPHPLREVGGPISRVAGGPFSGYAADLDGKRYFTIPYAETGDLNISGPEAQVSMFAVVRIVNLKQSRTIAGMWSEGKGANDDTGTRQYALLMNMPTYGGPNKLVPHISSEGGVTRRADGSAFPWCCDYAVSTHEVPTETWCTLGFTYDGRFIRAYVNGGLDELKLDPVVHKRTDRYFTHEGPGGGDRGMNPSIRSGKTCRDQAGRRQRLHRRRALCRGQDARRGDDRPLRRAGGLQPRAQRRGDEAAARRRGCQRVEPVGQSGPLRKRPPRRCARRIGTGATRVVRGTSRGIHIPGAALRGGGWWQVGRSPR
jgi:hypothetical protein